MEALLRAIAATAQPSVGDHLRRLAVASLGAIAVGILLTASAGCAAASLWIVTIPLLGPAGAPLAVAAALLASGLAALFLTTRRRRRYRVRRSSSADPILADAMRLFRDHKGAGLMAALVAGLAAGRNDD
jgi:hypothetical protein